MLPRVVELARKAGLVAPVITTSIYDAAAPRAESILATMKGVGITEYRSPAVHYDYSRDFGQQLDRAQTSHRHLSQAERQARGHGDVPHSLLPRVGRRGSVGSVDDDQGHGP